MYLSTTMAANFQSLSVCNEQPVLEAKQDVKRADRLSGVLALHAGGDELELDVDHLEVDQHPVQARVHQVCTRYSLGHGPRVERKLSLGFSK